MRNSQRGSALIIVISVLAALGVLAMAMFASALDSSKWTAREISDFRAQVAAESAATMAASRVWANFQGFMSNQSANIQDYRFFMDGLGLTDQGAAAKPADVDFRVASGVPLVDGRHVLDEVEIERLDIHRIDQNSTSLLMVSCTAIVREGNTNGVAREFTESVRQVFVVAPPDWEGLQFAMLANNINCLMCHTEVDNVRRYYDEDSSKYGTYRRVRLGSIESFHVRSDPQSWFAGTLYLGGDAVGENGDQLTNWNTLNMKSREFDFRGLLAQDSWGDTTPTTLVPADAADPMPMENLYRDYLANGAAGMVDGYMPETFPPIFLDDGGYNPATKTATPEYANNRIVDHNEFMTSVAGAKGDLSGGIIGLSPLGTTVSGQAQLDSLTAGTETELTSITEGNVYLHGTVDDPILLNGDIAIDGDLIVSGVIKGSGSLKVSGNVYVPSDLVYLDAQGGGGQRLFGLSADGTKNAVALASAGNVMVGDPYHPAWGLGDPTTGYEDESFNFLLEEMAIFNRMEWMKTQPTLPGEEVYTLTDTIETIIEHDVMALVTWDEDVPIFDDVVVGTMDIPIFDWVVTGQNEEPVFGWVVTGQNEEPVFGWVVTGQVEEPVFGWVVTGTVDQPVYGWVVTGTVDVPVYGWVVTGQTEQPVYGWVITGTTQEPIYGNVLVEERPAEYGGDIYEWGIVGYEDVPVKEWQQTGTKMVDVKEWQQTGTVTNDVKEWLQTGTVTKDVKEWLQTGTQMVDVEDWQQTGTQMVDIEEYLQTGTVMVDVEEWQQVDTETVDVTEEQIVGYVTETHSEMQPTGEKWFETQVEEIWEWVIPQLTNPYYQGVGYIPRYYSFASGSPVPVFNKSGYFDGNIWHSSERAEGWDEDRLTIASPFDTSDPLLYDASGNPKAVVSSVTPTAGWLSDSLLRGLIQGQQATRDDTKPLEIDGTLYSSNAIFGLVPSRRAPGMNGKMLINGSVVAADVGLLAPEGTQLNYDERSKDLMTIRSATRLAMRRRLWMPQSELR